MKNIIILIAVLFSQVCFAITYKSHVEFNSNNELEKSLIINCDVKNKIFCQSLCSRPYECKVPETLCRDCASIKNQSLYSTYLDAQSIFQADNDFKVTPGIALEFIKNRKFTSLTADSFLNILNPEKKNQLKKEFNAFCEEKYSESIILATLNEDTNSIDKISAVICQNKIESKFKAIKLNPNYFEDQNTYWKQLRFDIYYKLKENYNEQNLIYDGLPSLEKIEYTKLIEARNKVNLYLYPNPY